MKRFRLAVILALCSGMALAGGDLSKPGTYTFWDWLGNIIVAPMEILFDNLVFLIQWNPVIYCLPADVAHGCTVTAGIDKLMPYFYSLLIPLYIVAFLFTAIYFVVKTTNPRGRARAKSMLTKLFLSMIVVGMSPIIYQAMLDISSAFVNLILEFAEESGTLDWGAFKQTALSGRSLGIVCVFVYGLFVELFAVIMAMVRFFAVIFFAAIFPFIIFLFMFDLTRSFGRKYLRMAMGWIFTPVIQALFLVFTVFALDSITPLFVGEILPSAAGPFVSFLMALAGMTMVGIAPLIMNKLMALVGAGIVSYGLAMNEPWVAGLGALMEGRKSGAIRLTKTVLTRATPTAHGLGAATRGLSMSGMPRGAFAGPVFRAGGGQGGEKAAAGGRPSGEAPAAGMSKGDIGEAIDTEMGAIRRGTGVTTARSARSETADGGSDARGLEVRPVFREAVAGLSGRERFDRFRGPDEIARADASEGEMTGGGKTTFYNELRRARERVEEGKDFDLRIAKIRDDEMAKRAREIRDTRTRFETERKKRAREEALPTKPPRKQKKRKDEG